MTKTQSNKKVSELLVKLGKATEQQEKREIRAELRSLGHRGGLNKPRKKKKAKTAKKRVVKKKKAKG